MCFWSWRRWHRRMQLLLHAGSILTVVIEGKVRSGIQRHVNRQQYGTARLCFRSSHPCRRQRDYRFGGTASRDHLSVCTPQLSPVFIEPISRAMAELSWPWVAGYAYWCRLAARGWLPIPVLTGPDVEQLRHCWVAGATPLLLHV